MQGLCIGAWGGKRNHDGTKERWYEENQRAERQLLFKLNINNNRIYRIL